MMRALEIVGTACLYAAAFLLVATIFAQVAIYVANL